MLRSVAAVHASALVRTRYICREALTVFLEASALLAMAAGQMPFRHGFSILLNAWSKSVWVTLQNIVDCSDSLSLTLDTVVAVHAIAVLAVLADAEAVTIKLKAFALLAIAFYLALPLA